MSEQSIPARPPEQVEYRDLVPLGFPDYSIGNDGSLWSFKSGQWRRLRCGVNAAGYPRSNLNGDQMVYVHALVLTAFVGPRPAGMECRHLDGDPCNNSLPNLAWGTHADNMADRSRHGVWLPALRAAVRIRGRVGSLCSTARLTEDDVRSIRAAYAAGVTQTELARRFRVTQATISRCIRAIAWRHV